MKLSPRLKKAEDGSLLSLQDAYPVGTTLDAVKVLRVDSERGLVAGIEPGVEGFVHVGFFISLGSSHANYLLDISYIR